MPKRRFAVLLALLITVVINYLDRTNISIAAIDLSRELSLSHIQMGLVFSAFAWSYSLCQVPGGILADKVRPRLLYPVLLTLWSLATIIQGLAGGILLLLTCRVLVGVFEAPAYSINNRVVSCWFPIHERAGAIGFYTSGQFMGLAVLAPALAAFQSAFGWRGLFYACGGLGILWAWIWRATYRDPDEPGVLDQTQRAALGVEGTLFEPPALSSNAATVSPWRQLAMIVTDRRLLGIYLGQYCIGTMSIFFLTWFPTYLVQSRGIALQQVGWMASIPFLAAMLGVLTSGLLSDWLVRKGCSTGIARKGPVLCGILLSSSVLGVLVVKSDSAMLALMSLAFFGNGMASITWVFVSLLAPPGRIGMVGGLFNFIGGLSAVVTPVAVGYLIDGDDFSKALVYVGMIGLGGIFAYTAIVGRIDGAEASPEHMQ